jgi:hypothetical protein
MEKRHMRIALALLLGCLLQACAGRQPKPETKPCVTELQWDGGKYDQCPEAAR